MPLAAVEDAGLERRRRAAVALDGDGRDVDGKAGQGRAEESRRGQRDGSATADDDGSTREASARQSSSEVDEGAGRHGSGLEERGEGEGKREGRADEALERKVNRATRSVRGISLRCPGRPSAVSHAGSQADTRVRMSTRASLGQPGCQIDRHERCRVGGQGRSSRRCVRARHETRGDASKMPSHRSPPPSQPSPAAHSCRPQKRRPAASESSATGLRRKPAGHDAQKNTARAASGRPLSSEDAPGAVRWPGRFKSMSARQREAASA